MAHFESRYPFTAIPNWILKKQAEESGWLSCSEFCVLISLQFFADGMNGESGVYPSYQTICSYANVSKRTAMQCIASLIEKGLLEKRSRVDDKGQKTNMYYLKIWNHEPPGRVAREPQEGVGTGGNGCTGGVQILHGGGANSAPKQEPMNKNNPKPPYTPLPGSSGSQAAPPPRPVPPVALTRKQTKFIAVKENIPIKLQPVANDVCNFFNNHKGGQKTKTAFDGLINNLIRILDDPHGGIQDVKAQLKEAIQRSVDGEKKWHSITYSNWERFGKKQRPAWDAANTRASTAALVQVFEEDEAAVLSL